MAYLMKRFGGRFPKANGFNCFSRQQFVKSRWSTTRDAFQCLSCSSAHKSNKELSYFHNVGQFPLIGKTIGQIMDETTERFPDRDSHVFCKDGVRRTFEQFREETEKFALGLLTLGIRKGDRVGMWGPSTLEWVLTQFATSRIGAILVNINPVYRVHELEYALKKAGCKAVVCDKTFRTLDYYAMILELCPELDTAKPGQLKSAKLPELETVIFRGQDNLPGTVNSVDLLTMGGSTERKLRDDIERTIQFDEPINIQFTSGTTGFPKGVTLTHHNIVNNCFNIGYILGYHEKDHRICIPVPLYHCFGMVGGTLCGMVHGATGVFPAPGFDAEASLEAIQSEKCTSLYGVPTMFVEMLHHPRLSEFDVSSLSIGIMGGSQCPIEIMKQCIAKLNMKDVTVYVTLRCTSLYGTPTMFIDMLHHPTLSEFDVSSLSTGIMAGSPCPIETMKQCIAQLNIKGVSICYGLTETSPVIFQTRRDDPVEIRVSTIGKAAAHNEVKIINPQTGEIVPRNTSGELCSRGYATMMGYWEDREKTDDCIDDGRWFHTGDIAVMDDEGYVSIVGRSSDMIIRGGENIYPVEIENFLYKHPKINDVQVIGVPDERLGEIVCAWIKLKEGQTATEDDIKQFCKGEIADFKIPKIIHFVPEFPLTVTGKVQKFKLREEMKKIMDTK